jgi:hypothetical protein
MLKIFITLFVFAELALSCPVGRSGLSAGHIATLKKSLGKRPSRRRVASSGGLPSLPTADSPHPWGGPRPDHWKPEAILANAMSSMMNESWKSADVADVIVSSPVKMIFTNERVYGDGQTNSSLSFGPSWKESTPPLVAALITSTNGSRKVHFHLPSSTSLTPLRLKIVFFTDENGKSVRGNETVTVAKSDSGIDGEWIVPATVRFGSLEHARVIWIQMGDAKQVLPLDFRMPIYSVNRLIKAAGTAKTAGLSPLDPLQVSARSLAARNLPELVLLNSNYGPQWVKNDQGSNVLRNESIHGSIHRDNSEIKTSVGGGLTWLVDKVEFTTFKNLYTCFDARRYEDDGSGKPSETSSGVPSGGGWHEIGDAAETIINDLETSPVMVGFATGLPWPTPPDQGEFYNGLSDVASVRWLKPGEALMTAAGDQTWKEDAAFRGPKHDGSSRATEPSGGGRNYHWFFFDEDSPICTQEWVHNERPTETGGLGLGIKQ